MHICININAQKRFIFDYGNFLFFKCHITNHKIYILTSHIAPKNVSLLRAKTRKEESYSLDSLA